MIKGAIIMANDVKVGIARMAAEVLQEIRADSGQSAYVPKDKIPSVFMRTDDERNVRLMVNG
jgi:hypothetical protein